MDLTCFGWTSDREQEFTSLRSRGWIPARVVAEDKHFFTVLSEAGELTAQVTGKLLHRCPSRAELPKVGDWVAVAPLPREEKAAIHQVLRRATWLSRKVAGRETEEQVLAANVDTVLVVQALDRSLNLRRLQRHLAMVRDGGATPVVVLNKADLCDDPAAAAATIEGSVDGAAVRVVSAQTGRGMKTLAGVCLAGATLAMLGPSGVGKSSLINRLLNEDLLDTAEVRESDRKGRHVTTWREMIPLPNGALVIDTPGLREAHLWLDEERLAEAFPEIDALALSCHFRDCRHQNEKRCAVLAALAAGSLARDRYESFIKLRNETGQLGRSRRERGAVERRRGTRLRTFGRETREEEGGR